MDSLLASSTVLRDWDSLEISLAEVEAIHERFG